MRLRTASILRFGSCGVLACLVFAAAGAYWMGAFSRPPPDDAGATRPGPVAGADSTLRSTANIAPETDPVRLREARRRNPRFFDYGDVVFWWDAVPDELRKVSLATGPESNVERADYAGAEACRTCHRENYEQWLEHPHRRMNALATSESVLGDYSGKKGIRYLGGEASFFREAGVDGGYRMQLTRGSARLLYDVRQTIGSRFYQYYVGRLLEGDFPADHPYRTTNHVLPFGYWLEGKQWVPVVHVGGEKPDGLRDDPFAPPMVPTAGEDFTPYAGNCSVCHTTFPLADDLLRKPNQIAAHTPVRLHWNMSAFLQQAHPELWGSLQHPADATAEQIDQMPIALMNYEAEDHAVNLGISCEACHLGCQAHVKDSRRNPDFHPRSPHLLVQTKTGKLETGRNHQNLNWACARCHVGPRPPFAAGMSTWNSVEYSDAMRGSCYSQLKCIDCHPPHRATGQSWSKSAQEDDTSCTRCHERYQSPAEVVRHTHHPAESVGSRCMNCHMPRINEGLQEVVRTHMIFSPTNTAMIEANHPNACNLCHTDQPIDWTLDKLKTWYGAKYSTQAINRAYPRRDGPVGAGWMRSSYEPVRLVGADAACRVGDRSLLPEILDVLDDPFLLNRQFAARGLERMLDIRLEELGYRFYMSSAERVEPLRRIREEVLKKPSP